MAIMSSQEELDFHSGDVAVRSVYFVHFDHDLEVCIYVWKHDGTIESRPSIYKIIFPMPAQLINA